MMPPGTRTAQIGCTPMHAPSWTPTTSAPRKEHGKKQRPPSVNDILKAAYQRYGRDRVTVQAVKRCLG